MLVVVSPPKRIGVRTDDGRCTSSKGRSTCQISGADLSPVALEVVAPKPAGIVATLTTAAADPDRPPPDLAPSEPAAIA